MSVLEKWKEKLLDLGKRNKLINYKDSRCAEIDVVYPSMSEVYKKMTGDTPKFQVYDCDSFIKRREDENLTMSKIIDGIKKEVKANQIVLLKKDALTLKIIKDIHKKAKESIVEKGINTLFMTFGFVHWRESETSNMWMRAPLILIPIKFTNESALDPYYVEEYEDEIIVNPTFAYKLYIEYNIKLPPIGEEEGAFEYLKKVAEYVAQLGWKVSTEVKISMFSFLKMNMYLDIKNNENIILQNPNVKALIGINQGGELGVPNIDAANSALHNVVDADSSQTEAIRMAKSGVSFVLQGPPGTGKSQTITNIIAESLADGKKVLFVSEKLAALRVVYNNLKKVSLEDFCLELHSHKTNKKEVIAELSRVMMKAKSEVSGNASKELAALYNARRQLDNYAEVLHRRNPVIEMSAFELYGEVAKLSGVRELEFFIRDIGEKGLTHLNSATQALSKYMEYSVSVGYDYRNNEWNGYIETDTSYEHKLKFKRGLEDVLSMFLEMKRMRSSLQSAHKISVSNYTEFAALINIFKLIGRLKFYSEMLFDAQKLSEIIENFKELDIISKEIKALNFELEDIFEPSVYELDAKAIYNRYRKLYTGCFRVFNKSYKKDRDDLKLCAINPKRKLSYKDMLEVLSKLARAQEKNQLLKSKNKLAKLTLSEEYRGKETDWAGIIADLSELSYQLECGINVTSLADFSISAFKAKQAKYIAAASDMQSMLDGFSGQFAFIERLFDRSIFNFKSEKIDEVLHKLQKCEENFEMLENWVRFYKLLTDARELGLVDYIHFLIKKNIPIGEYAKIYVLLFYKQWVFNILANNETLSGFDRISQDKCVEIFSEKDRLQFEISKAQINAKLSAMRPDLDLISGGSQVSVLSREGEKKRKQMPVRVLLSKIPELIQVLKPCFLMSPLSVSTFLDAETMEFDVAIFDEASQIFPEDALGAIYRAKQVIVVGDSKQMPPSNFFNATLTEDELDDENYDEDIDDFESILDICATCYRQNRLKWHYRSRNEALIAFSNRNYYGGELVTFPSADINKPYCGVDFYYQQNGVFDRKTKTNEVEAIYIAKLVFDNFKKFPNRSLGVVAFSQAQQERIENAISELRDKNKDMEHFFSDELAEPFFVKNLETVQGDERDTIIFSVAYARDINGKFLHNFGPLNRQGGERRLNVAVTRAKQNVQVVSSIKHLDIDLSKTKAEGARLLKEYLEYAENGAEALGGNRTGSEKFKAGFELEVYNFLIESGYNADMQVGSSSYKIDIAVRRPGHEEYVMAIECDGESYLASRSTRDRDRLRREVLEKLGWKFYRVWSTDWMKNNKVEKARLLKALKSACDGAIIPGGVNKTGGVNAFMTDAKKLPVVFHYFVEADLSAFVLGDDPLKIAEAIIKKQAPVSYDVALKKLLPFMNKTKVTAAVKAEFDDILARLGYVFVRDGFIYIEGQTSFPLRVPFENNAPREIKRIALEELAGGMEILIKQNVEIERSGLFKSLASMLGFSRAGDSITARFDAALGVLKAEQRVKVDGELISIKLHG